MSLAKRTSLTALVLLFLALPFLVYFKAQALVDWWRLRNYTAPASIASLAAADTMTNYARHVFYVNHPQLISDIPAFRQACNENEKTIVLGCYHSDQEGIDIYSVQDSRLAGIEQVTAAHEMLHAAYDRLSAKDKSYVDGLLQDYYKNDLRDQRIIDTMNSYKQSEPGQLVNEMHSVFGTEIPNLPAPLENYYKRYFANRAAITTFAASYQNEFTSRQNTINQDDSRLSTLKQQITDEQSSLQSQLDQINADRARLDSEKSSGNTEAYNAGVDSFNAEVSAYNAGVVKLKALIDTYNQLVVERNSIAQALASLDAAIDTRLTTQSAQ